MTGRRLVEGSSEQMALLSFGEVDLAFQRVDDDRAPRSPDSAHPEQFHLDLEVTVEGVRVRYRQGLRTGTQTYGVDLSTTS